MASQSDGFWYDFGQTDRLFQENVGPTPANDPAEVIGLALSSRLWAGRTLTEELAGQAEFVTNGDFSNGTTGWTTNSTTQSVVAGALRVAATAANGFSNQTLLGLNTSRMYRLSCTVSNVSGGVVVVLVRTNVGAAIVNTAIVSGAGPQAVEIFFQPTTSDVQVRLQVGTSGQSADFDNVSVKEVSRYPATQATGSFKPTFQTTGAKFDGTDDNLLTGYLAQAAAGGNFLVARVTVPVTLAGTQIIAGTNDSGGANPFRLGITTAGALRATVGAGSTLDSTGIDLRGTETVVGLSYDGATVRTFAGSAQVGSFAETGAISTTVPFRLGARNDNGTAATFFAGSIDSILAGRQALDNARFNQIAAALMAA
jgi:hypothetical protein